MCLRVLRLSSLLVVIACGCGANKAAAPLSTTPATETSSPSTSTTTADTAATSFDQVETTSPTPTPSGLDQNGIRVTLAEGCPSTVGGHPDFHSTAAGWIVNPDGAGLVDRFVPGEPSAALICRYAALDADGNVPDGTNLNGGDLYSSTPVEVQDAITLANTLNSIVPWDFGSGCLPHWTSLDTRQSCSLSQVEPTSTCGLKDWYGCPEVDNGARSSGPLVNGQGDDFPAKLNSLAGRAPGQNA